MAVQPRHLQHSGVVHAAVLGTLAHHTMGAAAQIMTDRLFLPAEFKFILLRVAHGHRLECHEPRSSPVAC
jgi:acyl-coenzyme A thioesterase PaaI-like protein